jgi:hypothetical protein
MKKCIVCGKETEKPFLSAFSHFYLYNAGQWKFLAGNIRTFGFLSGVWSTVQLICPVINTVVNWRYRKCDLELRPGK